MILALFIVNRTILMFKNFIILKFQQPQYENLHKTNVKHLNYKLYYQQLHVKCLCNFASYWLQAPWGWHDSVETCRTVIICEIIVQIWHSQDRSSWYILITKVNEMHCFSNLFWYRTLHVSDRSTVHHQEYISTVSINTTADAHTLAASSRLNWRPPPI